MEKQKLLLVVLCLMLSSLMLFGQTGNVTTNTLATNTLTANTRTMIEEGFDGEDFPPTGWTNSGWERKTINQHSGDGVAKASTTLGDYTLITPALEIEAGTEVEYWIRNQYDPWDYNTEYFKVMLSTTDADPASFTVELDNVPHDEYDSTYQKRVVSLQSYDGQTVYLAFIRHATGGNSFYLDDIKFNTIPDYNMNIAFPGGDAEVASGASYIYDATLTNSGTLNDSYNLTVDGTYNWAYEILNAAGTTEITTIDATTGSAANFKVKVTVPTTAANNATESLIVKAVSTNDSSVETTATVTTTAVAPNTLPYLEDFETVTNGPNDVKWTGNFLCSTITIPHGVNQSQGLYKHLTPQVFTGETLSPNIAFTGDNMAVKFDYRYVKSDDYPTVAEPLELGDTLRVSITTDGVTLTEIAMINEFNHITSNQFTTFVAEIPASFAGQIGKLHFWANWGANLNREYTLDIDNVRVDNQTANDLAITNLMLPANTIYFEENETIISTTVFNNGSEDKTNIAVELKINETAISTETIASLAAGASTTISKNWNVAIPTDRRGIYTISANLADDDNNENNVVSAPIEIYPAGAIVENFEGETFPPLGWSVDSDTWATMTWGPYEGTQYTQIGSDKSGRLVTPKLSILEGDQLLFYGKRGYSGGTLIIQSSTDMVTWNEVVLLEEMLTTWEQQIVDLTSLVGTDQYLAFFKENDGMVKLDFVTGPKVYVAPTPEMELSETALAFGDVAMGAETVKELTLRNIGNGDLVISALALEAADTGVSFTPAFTADITLAQDETHTITVTINTDAATTISTNLLITDNTADVRTQHTLAVTANVINTAIIGDFTEGFEGDVFPPLGWETIEWKVGNSGHTGEKSARATWNHPGEAVLTTPTLNLPDNYRVKFWYRDADVYRIDGHDTTFVEILTPAGVWNTISQLPSSAEMDEYAGFALNLSAYANQDIKLRWRDVNDSTASSFGIALDDITFEVAPILATPTNLASEVYENNNVRLTWDAPAEARNVTGYKVYRNGYVLGSTEADVRQYEDLNRPANSYSYYVTAVYGIDESAGSDIINVNVTWEPMYAPENLEAEVLNGNDVKLTWEAPSAPIDMLTWDSAVYAISIGIDDAADFEVAARFVTTDILDYNGRSLGMVAFFPSEENCEYTVRVWTGGNYGGVINSGNVVAEKVVANPTIGEWNFVILDTPVVVDITKELWIGYRANTQQGMPAGADAGPVVADKGDLVRFAGGEWASLKTVNADFDLNWLIRGVLMPTDVSSEPAIISTNKNQVVETEFRTEAKKVSEANWVGDSLFETRNTRAEITGYKIYRDGSELTTVDGATTLTYTDAGVAGGAHSYYVTAMYSSEESEASETVSVELTSGGNETAPAVNGLSGNYPNPFNPTTTISFSVKEDGPVTLEVFNLRGQKVKTLINDSRKAGDHKVMWEGTDNSNRVVASGFYMYKMSTKNFSSTKKMLLMK